MSNWATPQPATSVAASLLTPEGELVFVRIAVEPRHLEALLEALCQVDFPLNPELRHAAEDAHGRKLTLVEFPACAARVQAVRDALRGRGFDAGMLRVSSMLDELKTVARTQ